MRAGKHRQALVASAIKLYRRHGYSGTGLSDILKASGAPKGSLYHYFPEGKAQITAEAVSVAGGVVGRILGELAARAPDGEAFIVAYGETLASLLSKSGYRDGCPISTILLETTPGSDLIGEAGAQAFQDWLSVLAGVFVRDGLPPAAARSFARMTLSAFEGALILARTEQSVAALGDVTAELSALLRLRRGPQVSRMATT